ncbi:MAG: DUF2461 domain-containing protein [Shewanella sp.]|nr:DUF2461 domain-containing protein [Shewanella sp.]MCF1432019.1 DUF2461 domain-containing protein [Shewanella sp.]MCF1438488.1 DUF2461 domain-containing protein [Shewanella sp.]MCF1459469.1 DUF2461 domain-containing protein [Shewanella sp.]
MFSKRTFDFLQQLEKHNNRDWFKQHQTEYEADVRTPTLSFIRDMAAGIQALSPRLMAVPKKVGGSMMRPQRDTRFSADKRPYKTNIGIHFRHFQGKDVHAPGLYVHIAPDECFLGSGLWRPDPRALRSIRQCLDENPRGWNNAVAALNAAGFELAGDSLIRPPKGFDAGHPLLNDLKRKDFIAVLPLSRDQVLTDDFSTLCLTKFSAVGQLMAYLCFALNLDYCG